MATMEGTKTTQAIHDELVARLAGIEQEEEALKTERERIKDAVRALEGRRKPGRPAGQ